MKRFARFVAVPALAMTLVGTGAAFAGAGVAQASGSPLTIGFNDGLTGLNAAGATAGLNTLKGVANYINATGGIGGRKVTVKALDSGSPGSGAASGNSTQLTQANVPVIFGPTVSDDCEAVQPIVTTAKIPEICLYADGTQLVPVQPYIFEGAGLENTFVLPIDKFLKKTTGVSKPKISVLVNFTAGATNSASKFQATAGAAGVTIASMGSMSETATSVGTYVSQILQAKPDGVAMDVFPNFVSPIIQGLRAGGFKGPIVTFVQVMGYASQASLNDSKLYAMSGAGYLYPAGSSLASGYSSKLKLLVKSLGRAGLKTTALLNQGGSGTTQTTSDLDVLLALRSCGANCTGAQLAKKLTSYTLNFPGLVTGFKYKTSFHQGFNAFQFWGWNTSTKVAVNAGTAPAGSPSNTKL